MDRIFLDTNVLLDFILDRKPFSDQAEEVIQLGHTHKRKLYTSVLSMANVAYLVRKAGRDPYETLRELTNFIELTSMTSADFESAMGSKFKDFEDALQFYSASSIKANVIITRDPKGFNASPIPVLSPTQFLKQLK